VSRLILLDAGPLGLVTNPKPDPAAERCRAWLARMVHRVVVPEIADYEVRRELLRARRLGGIGRLDRLVARPRGYLPITTAVMHRAAALWADARSSGRQTADDRVLDGDIILAAQALLLAEEGFEVIVATANVGHLARFVTASLWESIDATA